MVCPICYWEDDALQLEFATTLAGGANGPTLLQAQRVYQDNGACELEMLAHVRPPGPGDWRDPTWRPIDPDFDSFADWDSPKRDRVPELDERLYYWRPTFWRRSLPKDKDREEERRAVIEQIGTIFQDVRIEDGITLHEAEVIDDYGTDEERKEARQNDPEVRWQDVPDWKLEKLQGLPFLDGKGIRFYLPAYMVWNLRNLEIAGSNSVDRTIYELERFDRRSLFNEGESKAILRFLQYIVTYGKRYADAEAARRVIERYRGRFQSP